jgi:hypothetical protein
VLADGYGPAGAALRKHDVERVGLADAKLERSSRHLEHSGHHAVHEVEAEPAVHPKLHLGIEERELLDAAARARAEKSSGHHWRCDRWLSTTAHSLMKLCHSTCDRTK